MLSKDIVYLLIFLSTRTIHFQARVMVNEYLIFSFAVIAAFYTQRDILKITLFSCDVVVVVVVAFRYIGEYIYRLQIFQN